MEFLSGFCASLIEMTGGGAGAFGFLRRGVLDGRLGVLVAIDDLYKLEL